MMRARPRWLTTPRRFKRRRSRLIVSRLVPIMSARIWWVSGRVMAVPARSSTPCAAPSFKRTAGITVTTQGRERPGQKRACRDRQEELPEHVSRPKDAKDGHLAALRQVTQRDQSRLQHVEGVRRVSRREDGSPPGEAPFGADPRYLPVLLRREGLPQLDRRDHRNVSRSLPDRPHGPKRTEGGASARIPIRRPVLDPQVQMKQPPRPRAARAPPPTVKSSPHNDGQGVYRTAEEALCGSARQAERGPGRWSARRGSPAAMPERMDGLTCDRI